MALASLLALLDDIAAVLDDVGAMTQVAARKTAGVLGDDLALNAQQVSGVSADRELPVVWAVAKGSMRNKAILVPAALLISAVAPWLVLPLLMVGGAYLCFEGFEKVLHALMRHEDEGGPAAHLPPPEVDLVEFEKDKIQGAIRTDFILSAEIVTIALGTVADASLWTRVGVLVGVAVLMTVGVYGLVAAIVKMDDVGLHLCRDASGSIRPQGVGPAVGRLLLALAPRLMRTLTVVGTAAMFLVGGSILTHGWPALHHGVEALQAHVSGSALATWAVGTVGDLLVGIAAGAVVLGAVKLLTPLWRLRSTKAA